MNLSEAEMISLLKLAVPKERIADAQAIASAALKMAIIRFNKATHADFNHKAVSFSVISGRRDHTIGNHIVFSVGTKVLGIADVYVSGTSGNPVEVLSKEQFDAYAVNSDDTGKPLACSFHSGDTLSFWPTPDSNYTIKATIKVPIGGYDTIPEDAQPELKALAIEEIVMLSDPNVVAMEAQKAEISIKSMGTQKWVGQNIPVGRGMDNTSTRSKVDSGNLLGN
jgi:hypothetical protein